MKHANLSIFVPHNGCPNRCVFCNQVRISGESKESTGEEVRALCEAHLAENAGRECEIAFFGGSFTAVRREYMLELLRAAYPFVQSGMAAGIRLSTRPDAIDAEIISILKAYGVTAVELGAQSMDDGVLRLNRRGHTAADVVRASGMIKAAGISLGLQMMVGMYGEADPAAGAMATASAIAQLKPDTVRIYPTLVVRDTELLQLYLSGEYTPLSVDDAAEISAKLISLFDSCGIRVIRVGLHSDESLRESIVAGPFHPAFRELCESLILRERLSSLLCGKQPGQYTAAVAKGGVSRAAGNRRSNIIFFKEQGTELRFSEDPSLSRYDAKLI